ncbi:MAG: Crp/Fnr family transcriptional regulator [SAR324 cluster bacterium]|nr:Crp/Fnr family transcriptional regulator [SAR324 cluster bacterium]
METRTNYIDQVLGDNPDALMAIREVPHFRDSSRKLLDLIYKYGRIFALNEGEVLTREKEFDQWVFFILSGRLAVYVDDEWVDTISSSLVGERCILGEPRKATLQAAEEGMTALGVDMALLDLLNDPDRPDGEDLSVCVELLSLITGEILNRIVDLAYNQIDVAGKHRTYLDSEHTAEIIHKLRENAYAADPQVNIEVFKFLKSRANFRLASCLSGDGITVDTRKFYAHCVNIGEHGLIYDLAETLRRGNDSSGGVRSPSAAINRNSPFHFKDFARIVGERISERDRERNPVNGVTASGWKSRFKLSNELQIDLPGVCAWLGQSHGFSEIDLIETLMIILKEASDYTARINASIKSMIRELGEIKFLRKLQSVATETDASAPDFYISRTPEEMIPLFSKHVLEVHLIKPYLERLKAREPVPPAVPHPKAADDQDSGAQADGGSQSLADDLFD